MKCVGRELDASWRLIHISRFRGSKVLDGHGVSEEISFSKIISRIMISLKGFLII